MSSKGKSSDETGDGAALVPKLRFPEFQGTAGWPLDHLRKFASIAKGEQLPASEKDNDAVYPHFNGGISPSSYTRKKNREANTIIISEGGNSCGYVQFVDVPFWCGGHCYSLTSSSDVVTGCLLYSLQYQQSQIMALRVGSGLPNIQKSTLEKFFLALPPTVNEQQKIADCLDWADALIAAQGRKVGALRTHKKGLMQQLFPQEGETQPRLRFPEFEGLGEWEEGTLSDIGTVLQGYGFPERHQGQQSGDFPFYKVSDISRSLGAGKTFIEEAANYVNESQLKELRAKPIPPGTTVFAKIGEAIRSNRRVITTVPCLIDNNAAGVKSIKTKATDFFIYLTMEQISLIDHAGGVVPAVNKSVIEAIPVKFPKVAEQRRIADCLTSLDDLIAVETKKRDTLKTHKKGLMQQLFPQVAAEDDA